MLHGAICTLLCCCYREYLEIKQMMYKDPKLLHHILGSLAGSIGDYANYQIESGAQVRMSMLICCQYRLSSLRCVAIAIRFRKQLA
jgi:Uroporphyrinogen decarboxylase (URO-D)